MSEAPSPVLDAFRLDGKVAVVTGASSGLGVAFAQALAQADKAWLARMTTRRVPLARWSEALEHRADDIKVVVDFTR